MPCSLPGSLSRYYVILQAPRRVKILRSSAGGTPEIFLILSLQKNAGATPALRKT